MQGKEKTNVYRRYTLNHVGIPRVVSIVPCPLHGQTNAEGVVSTFGDFAPMIFFLVITMQSTYLSVIPTPDIGR